MKISLSWLKSYIDFSLTASEVASILTQRGLEVAHIYPTIKGGLEGLIIGEVVSCIPHPNADRLKQTLVDIGSDKPCTIVCGAPNVKVSQKVVVAPIGSTIYHYKDPSPFQIKKVKIRGVVSEGMICAEDEVGIGPAHDGILVLNTTLPAGTPAKDYFKDLLDEILEIEITPNRADACSHLGVARELKAILHLSTTLPSIKAFQPTPSDLPLKIGSIDAALCPRYTGLLLKNIAIQPSPEWLRTRLSHIGVKPINNVVDVTNFILHELGQPLHAFDYDTITGKSLAVQLCAPATLFTGLDGVERKLAGHELMICDGAGPIAMAGILGGLRTSITNATQHVFMESAYFNPTVIRRAAQHHNLKTDASFRFERGTDPNLPLYALKRAVLLLQELIPSAAACEIIEYYPTPLEHFTIPITYAEINRCLGTTLEPSLVKQITTDLEIDIEAESDQGFIAKVPPYRVDVTRKADLIEEIARIYGYDRMPSRLATSYLSPENRIDQAYKVAEEVSQVLVANGFYEICTNSLTKEAYGAIDQKAIPILNPLSGATNILRPTLLFSGLEVIAYNLARRQYDLKLFEFGTIYSQTPSLDPLRSSTSAEACLCSSNTTEYAPVLDATSSKNCASQIGCERGLVYHEEKRLALWLTGQVEPPNWVRQLGPVTLQNMRNTIEQLMQKLGITDLAYSAITHPFYLQGVQGVNKEVTIVTFGQVQPSIIEQVAQPVFFADIHWGHLLKISKLKKVYEPISKFPAVTRDLSLVVDKMVLFQNIKDLVLKQGHKNIQAIHLFDVYEGAHLPADKKSYALRFTIQDNETTLDDQKIDQIMHQLIQTFERDLNGIIRR